MDNRDLCLSHLHLTPPLGGLRRIIAMPWGTEKLKSGMATRWWNNFEDMFIRFDRIRERDGQTDTQTPHDGIGRACIASRGK